MRYTLPSQVAGTNFRNISRIPLSTRERLLLTSSQEAAETGTCAYIAHEIWRIRCRFKRG